MCVCCELVVFLVTTGGGGEGDQPGIAALDPTSVGTDTVEAYAINIQHAV